MAMEPLPLGFGDFSMTTDAPPNFSSLWQLQDLRYHPQESVEEVKQRLAAATVELEATREEVRRKEQSIAGLVELVRRTAQERDQLRQQHQHLLLARELAVTSSGDSDKSLASSSSLLETTSAGSVEEDRSPAAAALDLLAAKKPLPQQGRMLQAVMEAGPLLQNLIVAGPLPRWRNPPPTKALPVVSPPSQSCAPMGLALSAH